ncbi:single-stranded-DNA-specific exonuclease RecJ [Thalassotalea euphylliae]|uniref:single-stranded-DNA-specific exonuclease RecJ n=1 Tax=Thalassotalea euphylliae TaxID=1655234 RepID=UPI00364242BD
MEKHIQRRVNQDASHLPQELHPIVKQIYANRGVTNAQELALTLSNIAAINSLSGVDAGCHLVYQALLENKKITIVGDFDADGATSTALMMDALRLLGSINHDFVVPNRFDYGYGLSPEIVDIAHQQGADVIITVDNGISCMAGVERAKSLGIIVIVTDHHLPGEKLPPADAIINPNQPDCNFPSKALAGVGVAFYFMSALRKHLRDNDWFTKRQIQEPNLGQLLDLVALGTVADVVPLDANNRILVSQGIKRIRAGHTRPGIQALIEVAGKNQQQLVANDFGFALGPRINAAGRLDDMTYGIQCLLAPDLMMARSMASELDTLNKARREIEQGIQAEAERVLASLSLADDKLPFAIALYQPDWHQGVIGIVAGRIKEKYHRPSIVFAKSDSNDNEIKGSARSIPGLHIRDLLEHIDSQHPGIIIKFGGHAMAAGLSVYTEQFDEFAQLFNNYAQTWLTKEQLTGTIWTDGDLPANLMTIEFAHHLRESGPWGQQFPEPIFDDEFELLQQRIVGEKHLKLVVQKSGVAFDAIAFNVDLKQWPNHKARSIRLAYSLDINEFRGKQSVQLMVAHLTA